MRKSKTIRILAVLALAISLLPMQALAGMTTSASHVPVGDQFLVTDSDMQQTQLEFWGDIAVFRDGRDKTNCYDPDFVDGTGWDIWAVDISTGIEFPVSQEDDTQTNPSVYGDTIVWADNANSKIMVRDLSTRDEWGIEHPDSNCVANPFIWDDTVVWVDSDASGGADIWVTDLETKESTVVVSADGEQDQPELYEDRLVYRSSTESKYSGPATYTVNVLDLSTMVNTQVSEATTSGGSPRSPSIWGDWAVWTQGDDAYAYNLSTDERVLVCADSATEGCIDVSEGIVVWSDERNRSGFEPDSVDKAMVAPMLEEGTGCDECATSETASEPGVEPSDPAVLSRMTAAVEEEEGCTGYDIYGYDLAAGIEFPVCIEMGRQNRPRIHEGTVLWVDRRACSPDWEGDDTGPDVWGVHLEAMYSGVAGDDRFETAVEASRKAFPAGSDTVVVATGFNWPDALVSSSLAGAVSGPVLLSRTDSLPAVAAAEIERLGAENVYIIGGEGAISTDVVDDLKVMLDGFVVRIAGAERCETANLVARKAVELLGAEYDGKSLVVTSLNYPDAICAAPVAAADGTPMFLAGADGVSASTKAAMLDVGVTETLIVGGVGAVSAATETQLDGVFGAANVDRIGGATRYDTAADFAQYGVDEIGLGWNGVAFATGQSFPDALTGGVMQGLTGSSILLTPSYSLHPAPASKLEANKADIAMVKFLGGTAAVSQTVRDEVKSILE